MSSWHENGRGGHYLLHRIRGAVVRIGTGTVGMVVSDTNCDPDAEGLSHCHNDIELPDGRRISVIDTHEMRRYRCLQPGERISLSEAGGPWIVGTVSSR